MSDAWCMDVDNFLASSATVGVEPFTLTSDENGLPGVPKTLSQGQLNVISWLVKLGDKATDGTAQGAAQVAIWSEEYGANLNFVDDLGVTFDNDLSNILKTAVLDASGGAAPGINLSFLVPGWTPRRRRLCSLPACLSSRRGRWA
jgi:hypothetical protein